MKLKSLPILNFYYLIYFGIVTTAVTISREYLLQHLTISLAVAVTFFFAPFIIILLAELTPSFAKWLRVSFFGYFRVSTFASLSFTVLTLFSGSFIYNYFSFGFSGEQVFLNVFFLNLILLFFISLVLTKRFQIKDPAGLLIQKVDAPEVYLYRNGVLRHIPDPPTLRLLGYSFADVQIVSEMEFAKYTVRPALESVATGRLIQAKDKPVVYIIIGEEKHHVPDPDTAMFLSSLNYRLQGQRVTETLDQSEVDKWPTGNPLISIIRE